MNESILPIDTRVDTCIINCQDNVGCITGCQNYFQSYVEINTCHRHSFFPESTIIGIPLGRTLQGNLEQCCSACRSTIDVDGYSCAGFTLNNETNTPICTFYSNETILRTEPLISETSYIYDRRYQMPSPPAPPATPPPPICSDYIENVNQALNCTNPLIFARLVGRNDVTECCDACRNISACSAFDYKQSICTLQQCSLNVRTKYDNISTTYIRLNYPQLPPLPPIKPPPQTPSNYPPPPPSFVFAPNSPSFNTPSLPPINFILEPEVIIPIVIGIILVIILIIILFIFCNEERATAVINIIKSLRGNKDQNITINVRNIADEFKTPNAPPGTEENIKTDEPQNDNIQNDDNTKKNEEIAETE